jgi:hypothetical protein
MYNWYGIVLQKSLPEITEISVREEGYTTKGCTHMQIGGRI